MDTPAARSCTSFGQLFLGDHGFAHLVDVKESVWCGAVDRVMAVQRFNLPYKPKEQALAVPSECRLPVKQSEERVLWKLQLGDGYDRHVLA